MSKAPTALDALAEQTPLEAGPRGKECTVAWLHRALPDSAASLDRALANRDGATTDDIIAALRDLGVPAQYLAPLNINRHRRESCRCGK